MSSPPPAAPTAAAPTPRDLARAEVRATYEITVGELTRTVTVARLAGGSCGTDQRYGLQFGDGPVHVVDASRPVPDVLSMLVADAAWEAGLVDIEDGFEVELLGVRHEAQVVDPRRKALRLADVGGAAAIKTAMPGRVVRTLVAEGDAVAKGQAVVVVEAMKMENELKAPREGTVKRLAVSPGDLVEAGTVLVELD